MKRWTRGMVKGAARLLLTAAVLLFSLCVSAGAAAPQERGGAVAVWDFEDLSPGETEPGMGEVLAGEVIQVLTERGEEVVERQRLLQALKEQGIGSSELADEETRLKLGRLIGARRMVFGSFLAIGPQLRIDVRLVEVETGSVSKAVQKTVTSGAMTEWLDAARQAAQELESAPHQ